MTKPDAPVRLAQRRAILALGLSGVSALAAWQLAPKRALAQSLGPMDLESLIPTSFGAWRVDTRGAVGIINPQQAALLSQLYSQLLTRTYIGPSGRRMMVSVAYGNDQRDGMQMHYPEICYPAQGFRLLANTPAELSLAGRTVPARRLEARLGDSRHEWVTYWSLIGQTVVRSGYQKKLVEMQYGFRGWIPDGLLFRVSTIGDRAEKEFSDQDHFLSDMVSQISAAVLPRLVGALPV